MQHFEDNTLHPLPVKVFSISEVSDAFRYMAQAKHIGKIVVTHEPMNLSLAADTIICSTGEAAFALCFIANLEMAYKCTIRYGIRLK